MKSSIHSTTFINLFGALTALNLVFGWWVGVFFRTHILLCGKKTKVKCKQSCAFRSLERSSVSPSARYFQCNHILSKKDGPFVLPPFTLPKEPTWRKFVKVRISLSNKWKILTLNTHLKSKNSYKKSFTLIKKQLPLIIKLYLNYVS